MIGGVGAFHVDVELVNPSRRLRTVKVAKLLVDTGREHTWIAEATLRGLGVSREKKDVPFLMANGQTITRQVGFAIVRIAERFTIDEVVFALPDDLQLLGARTLEGLNLTVDAARKRLVAAGPLPAAGT